jgi:hypothetical protein
MTRLSGTTRTAVAGLLLGLAGATAVGCSGSSSSISSSASTSTALCTSVDSLQTSTQKLRDMQVSENGVAAMGDQLRVVKADLDTVIAEGGAQYKPQVDQISGDLSALRSVAGTVKDDPSADTLATVKPALTTLVDDVKTLGNQVATRCP